MMTDDGNIQWSEEDSHLFIEYGDYFVPRRNEQIEILCSLVPDHLPAPKIIDICCGAGRISRALLERYSTATIIAFEGSAMMREQALENCAAQADRFEVHDFSLAERWWREFDEAPDFIFSSMALHHLEQDGKRRLFSDLAFQLAPNGRLAVADLMLPSDPATAQIWARQWDEDVAMRAKADDRPEVLAVFNDTNWNFYSDPTPNPRDKPTHLRDDLRWLEMAGLDEVEVHWLFAGHAIYSARQLEDD